jgi:hypothetical protein
MGVEEWGGGIEDNMKNTKFSFFLMVLMFFSVNLVWSQEQKKDSIIKNVLLKKALFSEYSKFITGRPNISSGSFASYDITENQANFSYLGVTKRLNIFGFQISGQNTDGKLPFVNNGSKNSNITFNPYFNILLGKDSLFEFEDNFYLEKELELIKIEEEYLNSSISLDHIKKELEQNILSYEKRSSIILNAIRLADSDSLRNVLIVELDKLNIVNKINIQKLKVYNDENITAEKLKLQNEKILKRRQIYDSIKFDFKQYKVKWVQISPYLINSLLSFKKDTLSPIDKKNNLSLGLNLIYSQLNVKNKSSNLNQIEFSVSKGFEKLLYEEQEKDGEKYYLGEYRPTINFGIKWDYQITFSASKNFIFHIYPNFQRIYKQNIIGTGFGLILNAVNLSAEDGSRLNTEIYYEKYNRLIPFNVGLKTTIPLRFLNL